MLLVVNKMDLPGSEETLAEIKDKLSHIHGETSIIICYLSMIHGSPLPNTALVISEFSEELPECMKCEKLVQFEEIIAISADQARGTEVVKDCVRSSLTYHAERALAETERKEENLQELKLGSREAGPLLV